LSCKASQQETSATQGSNADVQGFRNLSWLAAMSLHHQDASAHHPSKTWVKLLKTGPESTSLANHIEPIAFA